MNEIDFSKIEIEDIDSGGSWDYPDFSDAFISQASYDGRPMTHEELDELHDKHGDWVYEQIWDWIF